MIANYLHTGVTLLNQRAELELGSRQLLLEILEQPWTGRGLEGGWGAAEHHDAPARARQPAAS